MFTRTASRPLASAALALSAAAGLAAPAFAGPGNDYCVKHNFRITTPGNIPPVVYMVYDDHVRARTNTCQDTFGVKDVVGTMGPLGVGAVTTTAVSTAPDSTGDASSIANITGLGAGLVQGTIEANGNALPLLTGCPLPNPPRGFGRVVSASATKVMAHGQKMDRAGHISYTGTWHSSGTVAGSTRKTVGRDPIRARLLDLTAGVNTDYSLLSIDWLVGGPGEVAWDAGMLVNTAPELDLDIVMNSGITVQAGELHFKVRGGIVTQNASWGVWGGLPLPPVGAPGGFAAPLPSVEMDYNLGGNPAHSLETEFEFQGAGEVEKSIAGSGNETGTITVTQLESGYNGANISTIPLPYTSLEFPCFAPVGWCARAFNLQAGATAVPIELTALSVYSTGAVPEAGFVRIWQGLPGVGVVVAGDLTTNRLMDVEETGMYRVRDVNPLDNTRPVHLVNLDLSWAPNFLPGQYWFEFQFRDAAGAPVNAIQIPWDTNQADSGVYNPAINFWNYATDAGTGRRVSFAADLYYNNRPGQTACYANCDGSVAPPVLNVADFTCFLQKFAANDPYANCDGSVIPPVLNVADFTCFLQKFAAGCP